VVVRENIFVILLTATSNIAVKKFLSEIHDGSKFFDDYSNA